MKNSKHRDSYAYCIGNILRYFPTSPLHWKEHIQFMTILRQTNVLKKNFRFLLMKSVLIRPILINYLSFSRLLLQNNGLKGVTRFQKALRFILKRVGDNIDSGFIWNEYLKLLISIAKNAPNKLHFSNCEKWSNYYQGQISTAFHQCLETPHTELDTTFRLFLYNHKTPNQYQGRRSVKAIRRYFKARNESNRRRFIYAERTLYKIPFSGVRAELSCNRTKAIWRSIFGYERLRMSQMTFFTKSLRLNLAYEQALIVLYRNPGFWLKYATYLSTKKNKTECLKTLDRSAEACPHAISIRVMQAEILEQVGQNLNAKKLYQRYLLRVETTNDYYNKTNSSILIVNFMLFLRRTQSLLKARQLFLRMKKYNFCTWRVFLFSAMMEWRSSNSRDLRCRIVRNIFDKGLERFSEVPRYISAYVAWRVGIGDERNAEALIKKILQKNPLSRKCIMWRQCRDFFVSKGDFLADLRVKRQIAQSLLVSYSLSDTASLLIKVFLKKCQKKNKSKTHNYGSVTERCENELNISNFFHRLI
jgi:hypothetical protein